MSCSRKKTTVRNIFLIIIVIVLLVFLLVDYSVNILLERINESVAKNIVAEIVSDVVGDILRENDTSAEKMIEYTVSDSGSITSAVSNCAMINNISSQMTNRLSKAFDENFGKNYKTRLGNISSFPTIFGKGPEVEYELSYIGYPKIEFFSEFTSQGINQTRHRIIMNVRINVDTVIFPYSEKILYEFDYIISDGIIVGNVPDSFTQISGDDREVISKINDYN